MVSVILKATECCNANCYYCDVVQNKLARQSMLLDTLELVFVRCNEFLQAFEKERIDILWHGGEPLLLGPEYFEKAIFFQQRHCSGTSNRIGHSIQTNLTCFSAAFVPVFNQLGIHSVGTSYDPEPFMRGLGEKRDTEKYNQAFLASVDILEQHSIGWGLIYVITKKSLADPKSVFYFLTNLKLSGGINCNPVLIYDKHRQDVAISPAEYTDFLGEIFPLWWEHRQRYPHFEPFYSLTETIINGKIHLGCVHAGMCTYNHINIAPNGDTSQCGRSSDWGLLSYGNIQAHTFSEILKDKQRKILYDRLEKIYKTECRDCRFWEICHGGCPLDAWSKHKSFDHKSEWCESRRDFIEKYFEPVTGAKYQPLKRFLPA